MEKIILILFLISVIFFSLSKEYFNIKYSCSETCEKYKMKALHNKNIKNSCLCIPDGFVSAEDIHKKAHNMEII